MLFIQVNYNNYKENDDMKSDRIIRMIDNKEYASVEYDSIGKLSWFDVKLKNGNIIRVEKCHGVDGETYSFMVLYMVPNEKTATEIWHGDYRSNSYYIISNIYNRLENIFE
jgi:hypothetical protein